MTKLYTRNGEYPIELPFRAYDSEGRSWTDLANNPEGVEACGFVEAPEPPVFDPTTHRIDWDGEDWVLAELPPPPPPPEPQPAVLGKLQFISLVQSAGGMTDAQLVEAQKNPAYEAFWIKYQMASSVERDHAVTTEALAALEAGGYVPNGAQAVLDNWPTT